VGETLAEAGVATFADWEVERLGNLLMIRETLRRVKPPGDVTRVKPDILLRPCKVIDFALFWAR